MVGCVSMNPVQFAPGHVANPENAAAYTAESGSTLQTYVAPNPGNPILAEEKREIHKQHRGAMDMDMGPSKPATETHDHKSPAAALYTCPMHPKVVQDHEGRCPECQMKLVLKTDAPSNTDAEATP